MQQLPIPDMADPIWASIELQLDADIPGDGEGNSPSPEPSGKGGTGFGNKLYFLITTTIIIAGLVWIITGKKKDTSADKKSPDTTITGPPSVVADSGASEIFIAPENNKATSLPVLIPNNNQQASFVDSIKTIADSLNSTPQNILLIKDSIAAKILPVADSLSVTPAPKKPKGVKGISNADYKIVSDKKDSVKKNK